MRVVSFRSPMAEIQAIDREVTTRLICTIKDKDEIIRQQAIEIASLRLMLAMKESM